MATAEQYRERRHRYQRKVQVDGDLLTVSDLREALCYLSEAMGTAIAQRQYSRAASLASKARQLASHLPQNEAIRLPKPSRFTSRAH